MVQDKSLLPTPLAFTDVSRYTGGEGKYNYAVPDSAVSVSSLGVL